MNIVPAIKTTTNISRAEPFSKYTSATPLFDAETSPVKATARAAYGAVAFGAMAFLLFPNQSFARPKSESADEQLCLSEIGQPDPMGFSDDRYIVRSQYSGSSTFQPVSVVTSETKAGKFTSRQKRVSKPRSADITLSYRSLLGRGSPLAMPVTTPVSKDIFIDKRLAQPADINSLKVADGTADVQASVNFDVATARLHHLSTKPDGWKGTDSRAMSDATKTAALTFLRRYHYGKKMIEPFIGLDADGDVTLFWKNDYIVMDLSIKSDGRYSYYAEAQGGLFFEGDDLPVHVSLPMELRAKLSHDEA